MKAVILAAGCATRLRPYSDDTPKTLLPVGGVPILRRTITSLLRGRLRSVRDRHRLPRAHGARRGRQLVPGPRRHLRHQPRLTRPRTTRTRCCSCATHVEHDGFILLDGDVVFDLGVVEELIERGPDCLAVRSVGEIGLEEVKVTADNEDRVLAIGKHVPVRSAMGESVGIELFSAASSKPAVRRAPPAGPRARPGQRVLRGRVPADHRRRRHAVRGRHRLDVRHRDRHGRGPHGGQRPARAAPGVRRPRRRPAPRGVTAVCPRPAPRKGAPGMHIVCISRRFARGGGRSRACDAGRPGGCSRCARRTDLATMPPCDGC